MNKRQTIIKDTFLQIPRLGEQVNTSIKIYFLWSSTYSCDPFNQACSLKGYNIPSVLIRLPKFLLNSLKT